MARECSFHTVCLKIGNFALRIDPILLLSAGQVLFHGPDLNLLVGPGADLFLGLGSSRLLGPDPGLFLGLGSGRFLLDLNPGISLSFGWGLFLVVSPSLSLSLSHVI